MEEKARDTLIELKHIKKVFEDGVTVIEDLSLEVKKGEFVTLLGPSGCGKTTILRMIGGFEKPTSGELLLNGKDISSLPPNERPINTVFQKYALFPHLNVYDNIAFGLKLKGLDKKTQEEKVQMVTDALVNKRIDLSGFTPNLQSSALTIKQDGTAVLTTDDGKQQYSHELTIAEQTRLSQILNSDADNATKQQRIGTMVYTITFAQQASQNYEQIATQQQSQEQTIQRK